MQGHGACHHFVENFARLPGRSECSHYCTTGRGQSGALDGPGVFALGGRWWQG